MTLHVKTHLSRNSRQLTEQPRLQHSKSVTLDIESRNFAAYLGSAFQFYYIQPISTTYIALTHSLGSQPTHSLDAIPLSIPSSSNLKQQLPIPILSLPQPNYFNEADKLLIHRTRMLRYYMVILRYVQIRKNKCYVAGSYAVMLMVR